MRRKILLIPFVVIIALSGGVWYVALLFGRGVWPAWGPVPYRSQERSVLPLPTEPLPSAGEGATENLLPGINETNFPVSVPDGFRLSFFAQNLGSVRVLAWDPSGTLLVSVTKEGKVLALPDRDEDGKADEIKTILSGLNGPHGMAFRNGWLYVAETHQVFRVRYDPDRLEIIGAREKIVDLPSGEDHFTRTIGFDNDGFLYVTAGSSCNVCLEEDPRRAAMLKVNTETKDWSVFAEGLRNTVFFISHPETEEFWGTDMGRDMLGDDLPPDELNIIREGKNYGWPICYGKKIHDTDFDKNRYVRDPCLDTEKTLYDIPAHSAPLGLRFIDSPQFHKEWRGDLLVAYHGSWNRSVPTGYKVVRLDVDGEKILGEEDFLSGWLEGNSAVGRPVDLIFGDDGTLFVSDDKAGVIYRLAGLGGQG